MARSAPGEIISIWRNLLSEFIFEEIIMADIKTLLVALLVVGVLGCGEDAADEKPTGVIPEHQLKALEKAGGVEQALQDAQDKRDKEMEERGI